MKPPAHAPLAGPPAPRPAAPRPDRAPAPRVVPRTVFVAYARVPAARHAMACINQRMRRADCPWQPMLWRLDQLAAPRWREMALNDAARADLLVLALAEPATLGPGAETWLAELSTRVRGAPLTALAFLNDDDGWTISLQSVRAAGAHAAPEGAARPGRLPPLVTLPRKNSAQWAA